MTLLSRLIGLAADRWHQTGPRCACGEPATRTATDPADCGQIETCAKCGEDCDEKIRKELERG